MSIYIAIVNMGEEGSHVAGITTTNAEAIDIFRATWPVYDPEGEDSYDAFTADHPWEPFMPTSGNEGTTLWWRQLIADDQPWYNEIHRYDGPVPR